MIIEKIQDFVLEDLGFFNPLVQEVLNNQKAQDKVLGVIAESKGLRANMYIAEDSTHYNIQFNTGDVFVVPLKMQSLALTVPEVQEFILGYR